MTLLIILYLFLVISIENTLPFIETPLSKPLYQLFLILQVLILSCDRFKENYATSFLQVFKCFIQVLWKWLDIKVHIEPIKSKEQKRNELEEYKVSGMEDQTYISDDTREKSSQELFEEDMQKSQEDLKKEIEEPEGKRNKHIFCNAANSTLQTLKISFCYWDILEKAKFCNFFFPQLQCYYK